MLQVVSRNRKTAAGEEQRSVGMHQPEMMWDLDEAAHENHKDRQLSCHGRRMVIINTQI
jgi:hypothetical protein